MRQIRFANLLILALVVSLSQLAFGADKKDVDEIGTRKVAHKSIISQQSKVK